MKKLTAASLARLPLFDKPPLLRIGNNNITFC